MILMIKPTQQKPFTVGLYGKNSENDSSPLGSNWLRRTNLAREK